MNLEAYESHAIRNVNPECRLNLEQVCDDLYNSNDCIEALVVNPVSMIAAEFNEGPVPEVHAGLLETSMLLSIAPDQVKLGALKSLDFSKIDANVVRRRLGRRGVYWPWTSNDPNLAVDGIIGDPRAATAAIGDRIIAAAKAALVGVVEDFMSNVNKR